MSQKQNHNKKISSAEIYPEKQLEFSEVNQENGISLLKTTLTIKNTNNDSKIAFKLKTNNIQNYIVRPHSFGIIEMGKEIIIDIQMFNQQFAQENNDKFLIQIRKIQDNDVDAQKIWKETQNLICIEEKKFDIIIKSKNQFLSGNKYSPSESPIDGYKASNEIYKSIQNRNYDEFKKEDEQIKGELNFNNDNFIQKRNVNQSQYRSFNNQSFNTNQIFQSIAEPSDEYKKLYENLLIRVDEQEKIMFQLNEEKLRFQREHNNLKNLSAKNSKAGVETKGYQNGLKIWNAGIIAIISLLIGMFLSR